MVVQKGRRMIMSTPKIAAYCGLMGSGGLLLAVILGVSRISDVVVSAAFMLFVIGGLMIVWHVIGGLLIEDTGAKYDRHLS